MKAFFSSFIDNVPPGFIYFLRGATFHHYRSGRDMGLQDALRSDTDRISNDIKVAYEKTMQAMDI